VTGLVAMLLLVVAVLVFGMFKLGAGPVDAWRTLRSRPTMEMVRYAEFRLLGHPLLEAALLPVLNVVRHQLEREPGPILADLGKGQQPGSLPPPLFDAGGAAQEVAPSAGAATFPDASRSIATVSELQAALGEAKAGDVLELAPGTYRIDSTLITGRSGEPGLPVVLRARQPGTAHLVVSASQAIVVNRPYWLIENLDLRGECTPQARCEQGISVVGIAVDTVIRNNTISGFNVLVRVNGEDGHWPDNGLLQFNTLINESPRATDRNVTSVDIIAVDGWRVSDNLIKGFVRTGGNGISIGVSMKGGGSRGRIARNLVICTPQGISQPGLRVGISVGGVGTDPRFCRDGRCRVEHNEAQVINNVVAHCNDVGIDVNHSLSTLVAYNTMVNTLGVLVREKPSSATVQGNLLEGSIRIRNGGILTQQDHNLIVSRLDDVLTAPDALDLRWRELPAMLPLHPMVKDDFCHHLRPPANPPGAMLSAQCGNGSGEANR
jgi:hypothetical protein